MSVGKPELPAPLQRSHRTFSARAVEVLREMVLSGRLRSGERLNEVELAGALGISRGPLREAIQRLCSEGLLTPAVGRGAFVRTFTPETLRGLYEVRTALETHAVRLLVQRADPTRVDALTQLLEETKDEIGERGYPQDRDFHRQLIAQTGVVALLDTATEINRQIHLARSRSGHVLVRAAHAYAEHVAIMEFIAAGDVHRATDMLTRHIEVAFDSALTLLTQEQAPATR